MKKKAFTAVLPLFVCLCLLLGGCRAQVFQQNEGGYTVTKEVSLTDTITDIDIEWSAGKVRILTHPENTVELSELAREDTDENHSMAWHMEGTTLYIRFAKSSIVNFFSGVDKELTVTLPESLSLASLKIGVSSAFVSVDNINAECLEAESSSGKMELSLGTVRDLEISSSSGNVIADAVELKHWEASSSSGNVSLTAQRIGQGEAETSSGKIAVTAAEAVDGLDIETSSGGVTLTLPEDLGFSLTYDTASGDFNSEYALKQQKGIYVSGDGTCPIQVETSSGSLTVK